ncbi:GIY-YIG nuclease family protein [Streptomyces hirsutus]|uniref:GIY-YIG nuclease family protein n=1 Tax=Streptomyces hirsutus TaxID=35620 RepID=UPI0038700215|nr:GIY-YIG nuclease family protein [Streptomyces hirsutus]
MIVYAIGTSDARMVKIGYTTNLERRLSQIQVGCPLLLEVLWWTEAGPSFEEALHRIFAAQRLRGEWFELGPERLSMFDALHDELYSEAYGLIEHDAAQHHARQKASRIRAAILAQRKTGIESVPQGAVPTQAPAAPPPATVTVVPDEVHLTLHLPPDGLPSGTVEWLAVLDHGQQVARMSVPLAQGPHLRLKRSNGYRARFVVFAGNRAGVSLPSAAVDVTAHKG